MTFIERQLMVQAWAASIILHSIAVTLAVLLASQVKPLARQEPFHWNVSLVEPPQEQSVETSAQAGRPLTPALEPQVHPIQPVTTTPPVVLQEVQTRQPNPVVTVEQRQPFEAPEVVERPLVQTMTQPSLVQQQPVVFQNMPAVNEVRPVHEAEPVERSLESVAPSLAAEKRAVPVNLGDREPIRHSPPAATVDALIARTQASVLTEPAGATVIPPVSPEKAAPVIEAARDTQSPQMAVRSGKSIIPPTSAEPAQPMTRAAQRAPATRADYGWLIESLGARLAELKRYPEAARSNGMEGKVLLRAVIRADGHLAEVSVQKSSGNEELDAAAMQTMRDASPLQLRHELGRTQIAITVPLVYKLTN